MKLSTLFLFHFYQQDTSPGAGSMLETLQEMALQYGFAILNTIGIIIVGWLVARTISWMILKFLKRINLDAWADKVASGEVFGGKALEVSVSKIIARIVYYVVLLIFLIMAVDTLGIQSVSQMMVNGLEYIPVLLSSIALAMVGLWGAGLLRNLIQTTSRSIGIGSHKLLADGIFYFLVINVFIVALKQAGVPTEFFTANISILLGGAVGAFALGYGIASRETMANYLATLYTRDKFYIGSVIRVGQLEGIIIDKDNSSITLKTAEGLRVVVPMSHFLTHFVEIIEDNLLDEGEPKDETGEDMDSGEDPEQ